MENHYHTLGVSFRASPEEIKSAYKRLALIYHPDKNSGSKHHEERFKHISAAYQVLSDPDKKNLYDIKLFYSAATGQVGNSVYGGSVSKTHKYAERDPYFRRQSRTQEKSSGNSGRRANFSIQNFAIAMMIMTSIGMVALWFGDIMNRNTAKVHLEQGDFVTALEFDPQFGEAYYAKALHLRKIGFGPKSVIKELDKAIKYADKQTDDMYLARALEWIKANEPANAVKDLKVATALNPASYNTLVLLADILNFNLGEYSKAESYYEKAIAAGANAPLVYAGWGFAKLQQRRVQDALDAFNKGLKLDESQVDLYYYRGMAYQQLKDSASACADWDRALNMGKEEALPLYNQYCKPH